MGFEAMVSLKRSFFLLSSIFSLSFVSAEELPRGTFSLLTYNVAGIHNFFSPVKNKKNMKAIGQQLNHFDMAFLQENFSYYKMINKVADFPFKKKADFRGVLGSGLMRFSRTPFSHFKRFKWPKCSGILTRNSDCLAQKGFSRARHEISPGLFVDIYNIHADAGGHIKDKRARYVQFQFLMEEMNRFSEGRAVIVAGDWNLLHEDPDDNLIFYLFLRRENLTYMCETLHCEKSRLGSLDRVAFRSGRHIQLKIADLYSRGNDFFDSKGDPLSDHGPLSMSFQWAKVE
jgi:endonuclease/exonuclease/phosphatase family metal-dependent hydrolase